MGDQKPVIERELEKRILVLDGATGTMLQKYRLGEKEFRGERFKANAQDLKGNNDILSLTRPDIVTRVHEAYLQAGADIIETNTFNATAVSQQDYGLESLANEINLSGARLAREAADRWSTPEKPRYVAGVIGPTNRTCSISPDVNDPGYRDITFVDLVSGYRDAVVGLIDGGVDLLLVETIFDTLNAKAALYAVDAVFTERQQALPVMISGTITDASGRTLSGQTGEAFYNSLRHIKPLSFGFNCALGPAELRRHVAELSQICECYVSAHPNAGLPDACGEYDMSPQQMVAHLREWADSGLVNIIGGCCGTTPEHISAIAEAVETIPPRRIPEVAPGCRLAGLEPLRVTEESLFVNVGERTNVTGSARFKRLIKEEKYEEALEVAAQQVENGAQIIDVNMDEALLDAEKCMTHFLNLIASEPDIAKVPIMVDSSQWSVLEAGLRTIQGKGVVNSISLKEGEQVFVDHARLIKRYGAAVIVMAFDEDGQADTEERKVEICTRAFRILVDRAGFAPEDIIFDPNIFAVATGIKAHDNYGVDFIRATRRIRETLPGTLVSGGVSNVSFAFRGNNIVREAIHSVFLYHAIRAGMNMGIVNAGQMTIYDDIDPELKEAVEDVVLNRREDAAERLLDVAEKYRGVKAAAEQKNDQWRSLPVEERLKFALVNGITSHIDEDIEEARLLFERALDVIEGPLMSGMEQVGELFGDGRMFLPQVVKSARVMKRAVSCLDPYLQSSTEEGAVRGRIVIATVKGDVHDIGKNIASVVLQCNNFELIDLGVMVPCATIIDTAVREKADIIGLSGLITPSLEEMEHILAELARQNVDIPVVVSGATTSKDHTAVRLDPQYPRHVVHVSNASNAVAVCCALVEEKPETRAVFQEKIAEEYDRVRSRFHQGKKKQSLTLAEAQANRFDGFSGEWEGYRPPRPAECGIHQYSRVAIELLQKYINWRPFFRVWGLSGIYPNFDRSARGVEARKLWEDAQVLLADIIERDLLHPAGVLGLFPARASGDDVEIFTDESRKTLRDVARFMRQQKKRREGQPHLSLSDFIAPAGGYPDWIGAFAVTAGLEEEEHVSAFKERGDDYSAILFQAICDRLAEAMAEYLHLELRCRIWGYAGGEGLEPEELIGEKYVGIRPAPGYPTCPEHSEKERIWSLLEVEKRVGIQLTESCAMRPASSVSGWYFSHPASRYFVLGRIEADQAASYAERKGWSEAQMKKWLAPLL